MATARQRASELPLPVASDFQPLALKRALNVYARLLCAICALCETVGKGKSPMTGLLIVIVALLLAALAYFGLRIMAMQTRLREQETDFNVRQVKLERERKALDETVQSLRTQADRSEVNHTELARRQAQAEAKAQAAQQDYTAKKAIMLTLSNAAYDALIVVNRDCEIVATNTGAEMLFGLESPTGRKLIDATGVMELEMMVNDALINEEVEFEEQLSLMNRNYRVRAQVYHRDGQHLIGLAIHDITQLVKLNRARRDMVANISHELRTPIANIRLIIDGLFHDQDKPKRKDSILSLREIAKETDNLLWLVQEMSDLAMIESGQSIVRLIDHPLTELVEEAIERMEERAESANITLVRHVPEKMRVLCDRDLIQRVFVNLIHNAIKWSPEGESVTINANNGSDEVTISVLDNGPGVPVEAVDRIFERFYQVDSSRSGGDGTGLGLAICRHIVEAHGGRIWADSNADGAGGRFRFSLLSAGADIEADDIDSPATVEIVESAVSDDEDTTE